MQESAPAPPREGLCATCAHARRVTSDRGSVFVFVNLRPGEYDRLSRLVRRLLERGG